MYDFGMGMMPYVPQEHGDERPAPHHGQPPHFFRSAEPTLPRLQTNAPPRAAFVSPPAQSPTQAVSASSPGSAPSDRPGTQEASLRAAAEEDKRRRNTAASARFRSKKKQREAALEQSARALADEVRALRERNAELERDVKMLTKLVTDGMASSAQLPKELAKLDKLEEGQEEGAER